MRRGWKTALTGAVLLPAIGMLAVACGKTASDGQLNGDTPEAGNSSAVAVTKEPVELTYLISPGGLNQADFEKNINQQVRKKYPNFAIKPLEMWPQDALATHTSFDIIGGSFTTIGTLVDLGITTDITDAAKKYGVDLERFEPNLLKSIREAGGGKLFGLPYYANHQVMFYNKDLFDKFGAAYPKDNMTYEETLEIARKMTRTEGGATYRGFAGDLNSILGQNRYAASVVDPATHKASFAGDDRWRRLFDSLIPLFQVPGYNASEKLLDRNAQRDLFRKEKSAAMWVSGVSEYPRPQDHVNWDMVSEPVFSDYREGGPVAIFGLYLVSSTSKHKEEAVLAVEQLTSDEVQVWRAEQMTLMPVLRDPQIKAAIGRAAAFQGKNLKALTPASYSEPVHFGPYYADARKPLYQNLLQAITGATDVNTALRDATEAANKAIEAKLSASK